MSLLPDSEYVWFQYNLIPPRIRAHYGLDSLVVDGVKIAHHDFVKHLGKYGYVPAGLTDGLFVHKTHDISFTLVVNDFGIKYQRKEDVEHLIKVMCNKYTFKLDYNVKQYIGIHSFGMKLRSPTDKM